MIDKTKSTTDNRLRYRSPEVKVIFVKAQRVLCQSKGNDPMREFDYGDAGFGEV